MLGAAFYYHYPVVGGQGTTAYVYDNFFLIRPGAGCRKISDAGVAAMAAGCPSLRHLKLGQCRLLTSAAVAAVVRQCHILEELVLNGCSLIGTEAGAAIAAAGVPTHLLGLVDCPQVFPGISTIRSAIPALRIDL